MIKCINCSQYFESEKNLTKILVTTEDNNNLCELYKGQELKENEKVVDGCPDCLTDVFLTNIDLNNLNDEIVKSIWNSLTDIPVYEDADSVLRLECDWFIFHKDDEIVEDVWRWFDEHYSKGVGNLIN